jgi:2-methylcitrate dehydratase PrpD
MNNLAWFLVAQRAHDAASVAEGVELSERTAEATQGADPMVLDTLASAYASAGRYAEAVQVAKRAIVLASEGGQPELADEIRRNHALYQQRLPYRAH